MATVDVHKRARSSFTSLPKSGRKRIVDKLKDMLDDEWRDLQDYDVKPVKGSKEGVLRARIGDYRVFLVKTSPEKVVILHAENRDENTYSNIDHLDDRASN